MNSFKIIAILTVVILTTGCATKVTRVERSTKIDLSGFWNDYDAMLASQELIGDALSHPWLDRFDAVQKRKPVVIVGQVANRSDEHINTQVITKNLERELTNSGRVVFVATPAEREDVRDEREDQHKGWTDPSTIKEIGKERGADYMLLGSINSVTDEIRGKAARFYQVNLELIDITTNEKVWIGQKEIKKKVDRPQYSL
jgi:uncharacterized protein (TIGR02722 family)